MDLHPTRAYQHKGGKYIQSPHADIVKVEMRLLLKCLEGEQVVRKVSHIIEQ